MGKLNSEEYSRTIQELKEHNIFLSDQLDQSIIRISSLHTMISKIARINENHEIDEFLMECVQQHKDTENRYLELFGVDDL